MKVLFSFSILFSVCSQAAVNRCPISKELPSTCDCCCKSARGHGNFFHNESKMVVFNNKFCMAKKLSIVSLAIELLILPSSSLHVK